MTVDEWTIIIGMGFVTFSVRYLLLGLANRIQFSGIIEEALKYIPPAILTAIAFPAIFLPNGEWGLSISNPYLLAAASATVAGVVFKNLLVTVAVGLLVFFGFQIFM
jgi:branched-subunit amino acid transport protein